MKKLLILIFVAAAGLVVYNLTTSGELTLIPSFGLSDEERDVKALEDRLAAARKEVAQAQRMAGLSGIDSTSNVEAARRTAEQVDRELRKLRKRLSSDAALRRADRLADTVKQFLSEVR